MASRGSFKQIVGLALIMLLLSGCGGSAVAPTSTPAAIPPTTAVIPSISVSTPIAPASSSSRGLGTPASGGKWEVTITNAREEKQLMGSGGVESSKVVPPVVQR